MGWCFCQRQAARLHSLLLPYLRSLPRLLPVFRKLEAEVTGIHVDVQPKSPANSPAASLKKGELPVDYIEQLDCIAKTISNPDLKLAVTNLMRNRVKKS